MLTANDAYKLTPNGGQQQFIDFGQPIALLLVAILHFIRDAEDPAGIVARLRNAMAPGSYLAISHATGDLDPVTAATAAAVYDQAAVPMVLRGHSEVERLFDGFSLVTPGLVQVSQWRPRRRDAASREQVWAYGGVGHLTGNLRRTTHPAESHGPACDSDHIPTRPQATTERQVKPNLQHHERP